MSVSEVLQVISAWLGPCWDFFKLPYPLFGIKIGHIFIGAALATIGIRAVKRAIDSPEGAGGVNLNNRIHAGAEKLRRKRR